MQSQVEMRRSEVTNLASERNKPRAQRANDNHETKESAALATAWKERDIAVDK